MMIKHLAEKKWLLEVARKRLEAHINKTTYPFPIDTPQKWEQINGIFVTLTKNRELRGCIGILEGQKSVVKTVWDYVINAAIQDPRFSPVTSDELDQISIEISLLTKPEALIYTSPENLLKQIDHDSGLIFRLGYKRSTFLPQVWEQLPDKIDFLQHLAMKAGCNPNQWKTARYESYQVIHFSENDFD